MPILRKKNQNENQSLSLESLALLVDYRQYIHENSENITTCDTNCLISAMIETQRNFDSTKLKLKSPIKSIIHDKHKEDLLWLKSTYGIDYDIMPASGGLVISGSLSHSLSDIFLGFNEDRNRSFAARVLKSLL